MPSFWREFSLYQCLQGWGLCEWSGNDRVWTMSLDDIIDLHSQLGTTVVTKEKLQVLKWATKYQAFNQPPYHSRAAFKIHILGTQSWSRIFAAWWKQGFSKIEKSWAHGDKGHFVLWSQYFLIIKDLERNNLFLVYQCHLLWGCLVNSLTVWISRLMFTVRLCSGGILESLKMANRNSGQEN